MRKILAITVALMIAAIVLSPVMGYTIQSAGNQSYTVQSEKTNYTLQSEKANYTVTAGTPGHALTPDMLPGRTTPNAAVQVTKVPYSFKPGGAVPYSMQLGSGAQATIGGIQTPQTGETPARLGEGAPAVEPTVEPVVTQPAVSEVPPVNETPAVVDMPPVNETPAVVEVPPVNETPAVVDMPPVNETPAVPVEEPRFSIMGKVFDDANGNGAVDENETGLAAWTVSLEQPAGIIIANQTTAEDGSYAFMGLSAGEYAVSEVVQMGWTLVSPADGRYVVTITNMTIANLDFANQILPVPVEVPPENTTVPENTTTA
jgi:hypothetical protein